MSALPTQSDPFLDTARRLMGAQPQAQAQPSDPFLDTARRLMGGQAIGNATDPLAPPQPPASTHFRTGSEPFGQIQQGGVLTSDQILSGQGADTQQQADLRRQSAITQQMQQPTEADVSSVANSQGYLGRVGTRIGAGAANAVTKAQANWQNIAAAGGPLAYVESGGAGPNQPTQTEPGAAAPIGERLDPVTKFVADLPTMPIQLLDPDAIAAMLLTRGASGTAINNPVTQKVLGAIEQRFGPKIAGMVGNHIAHGAGVGAFSGAQTGIEGGTPEDIARSTGIGIAAGQAFALPGTAGIAGGMLKDARTAARAAEGRQAAEDYQQAMGGQGTRPAPTIPQERPPTPAPGSPEIPPEAPQPTATPEAAPVEQPPAPEAPPPIQPAAPEPTPPLATPAVIPPETPPAPVIEPETAAPPARPAPPITPRNAEEARAFIQSRRIPPEQEPSNVPQPEEAARQEVPRVRGQEPQVQEEAAPAQRPDALNPAGNDQRGDAGPKPDGDAPAPVLNEPYAKQPTGKPLSKKQVEDLLIQRHEQIAGPQERNQGDEQTGAGGSTRSFYRKIPSEITERLTKDEIKAAGLQVVDHPSKAGGEDYAYDIGWDKYISELKGDSGDAKLQAAKDFHRENPNDPEAAFYTALHDKLGSGKKVYSKTGLIDPKNLKAGDTFKVGGTDVRVVDEGSGENSYLVLKDGGDLPDTPVSAMGNVPVDKGTLGAVKQTGNKNPLNVGEQQTPKNSTETKARIEETRSKEKTDAQSATIEAGRTDSARPSQVRDGGISSGAGGDDPVLAPKDPEVSRGSGEAVPEGQDARGAGADAGEASGSGGDGEARPTKTEEPHTTSLTQDDIANLRTELNLDDLPEPVRRSRMDVLDIAKREGHDVEAEANAKHANEEGRPLSDEQHAGAVIKASELKKQYRDLIEQAQKADSDKQPEIAAGKRAEAEMVRARVNDLTAAIKMTNSSAGRTLAMIGLEMDDATHDPVKTLRDFEEAKGSKSTSEERQQIESLSKIILENQKVMEEAKKREARKDAAIAKMKAGQVLTRTIDRAEPGRKFTDAKQKLAFERNDIRKQLLSLTRRANDVTGIAPEALYLLGKLAMNHIRDGALTLAEVVKKVKEDAKDTFPDMTDDDVHLAMTTKDPARQARAKDFTEKRAEALKREAALLQKLKIEQPGKSMAAQTKMVLQQLRLNTKETIDAGRRRDAITAKIDALQKNLEEHTRPLKGKEPSEPPPDIAALKQQVEALRKSMRTEDTLTDLKEQIRTGDFKAAAKVEPKPVPRDIQLANLEIVRARQKLNQMIDKAKPATPYQKTAKFVRVWTRDIGALSYPTTFLKLAGAAASRTLTSPVENLTAYAIGKALPRLADGADVPQSLRTFAKSEAAAATRFFTDGIKGSVKMLKNQHTDLQAEFGKDHLPPELSNYFGQLHGAMKNPTKEAAFARALTILNENSVVRGEDISDPLTQIKNGTEAYKRAEAEIFQQKHAIADWWNQGLRNLETPDPKRTQANNTGRLLGAAFLRAMVPIVKVPLNFVTETGNYVAGAPVGAVRAVLAYTKGIDSLKDIERTAIIRQMSKGSLGAAALMLGFSLPQTFGGYYEQKERRGPNEPEAGGARIRGVNIPKILLHNPLFEAIHIGATIRRVADARLSKKQKDPNGLGSGMLAGAMGLIDEIPFVRQSADTDKLMDPNQRENYLGSLIASKTIPGMVQWTAKQTDRDSEGPIIRHPAGVTESVEAAIPGLRQNVPQFHTANQARERMHELYDAGKKAQAVQIKIQWNRDHAKDKIGDEFIGSPAQSRP